MKGVDISRPVPHRMVQKEVVDMSKSSDIRQKEVINVTNGSKMGFIADMEFSPDGHIHVLSMS